MSLLIAMVFSVVAFLSCSTAKDLTAFDVTCNLSRIYFNYPPKSPGFTEATIYTGMVHIPLDSILSANHIPSGFIASAYLSRLAMVITDPAEATFNWLESVRMIGSADSTFLQSTELGSDTAIYPDSKSVDLALKKVNLKPII